MLTESQKHRFEETQELDFSFGIRGLSRFRGNLFLQRGAVGGAFRTDSLLGPPARRARPAAGGRRDDEAAARPGAGHRPDRQRQVDHARGDDRLRSTTTRHEHIITLEDPIEFVHQHKSCVVNQREVVRRHAQLQRRRCATCCARTPTSC